MAAVVLHITGDLTFDQPLASKHWAEQLPSQQHITVDLAQVAKTDSTGVAVLVRLQRRAEVNDATIKFTNVPATLTKLLGFYGLNDIINVQPPLG